MHRENCVQLPNIKDIPSSFAAEDTKHVDA